MIKRIYIVGMLATLAYLLFFDGFVYSDGNWMTQIPASMLAAALWPVYWLAFPWIY